MSRASCVRAAVLAALLSYFVVAPAQAEPRVVVSLPPIHSLVAKLLDGVAKPELLMPSQVSEHLVDLSAHQVKALREADLVIWSGPELEGAINEAGLIMPSLSARKYTLSDHVVIMTQSRPGQPDTPGDKRDLRFWLDPRLAHMAVHMMVPALVRVFPQATDRILDNEIAVMHELHHLEQTIRTSLKTEESTPLHVGASDLRYLEWRFNLAQQGCARNGFDPIGFGLPSGPGLYNRLMDGARAAMAACQKQKIALAPR
jgi:zinc transport system substrate-binding protein